MTTPSTAMSMAPPVHIHHGLKMCGQRRQMKYENTPTMMTIPMSLNLRATLRSIEIMFIGDPPRRR